jgi:hypothetical protein
MVASLDTKSADGPLDELASIAPPSTKLWRPVAFGLIGLGGACLMLYGNAQNATRGAGPTATILGSVIVTTLACAVVVTSIVHSILRNTRARSTGTATRRTERDAQDRTCTRINAEYAGRPGNGMRPRL